MTAPTFGFQVTFDCHDVAAMGRFWAVALGYESEPPPPGYDSWSEFATRQGIPPEQWRNALRDPTGKGPRLFFQPVPEGKSAKNRVHLDINVTRPGLSPEERRTLIDEHVDRCVAAGARVLDRFDEPNEHYTVMADPEGNEFCIQ